MKKGIYKEVLLYGSWGSIMVIAMRLRRYKFTMEVFQNDFVSEFILGISVFIILGLLLPMKSEKKQEQ